MPSTDISRTITAPIGRPMTIIRFTNAATARASERCRLICTKRHRSSAHEAARHTSADAKLLPASAASG
ncbi:hypothetical protein C0Z17_02755 [Trinickia caryophylli]|nr:hypothetical protein C0Z17_02755 [Trinickia caryophylli]